MANAYTPPSIFPSGAKFISEKEYLEMSSNLYRNQEIKDLRNIAIIKTNTGKGVVKTTRVVWYPDNPELTVDVDGKYRQDTGGQDYVCDNPYEITLPKYFIDRESGRQVDLIIKCDIK